eukprot:gb/GEZN01008990.1/.p1 GENE.gb/GEZN01008990.1/~~gb/GEZN01008990.1/.p1  ORF type:complete len:400 (-),score=22.12 gb/GEZN01008990.1/:145-1344(-)
MWLHSKRAFLRARSATTLCSVMQSLRFVRHGSVALSWKDKARETLAETAKDVLVPTLVTNERRVHIPSPLDVEPDTSVKDAVKIIMDAGESYALVAERSQLFHDNSKYILGIVTGGDIINHVFKYVHMMSRAVSLTDAFQHHLETPVRDIMTRWPLHHVTENGSLIECLRLIKKGVWHIPVLKSAKSERVKLGEIHAILTRPVLMQALEPLVAMREAEAIQDDAEFLTAKHMMAAAYAVPKESASFCFNTDKLLTTISMMAEKKLRILPVFSRSDPNSRQIMCHSDFLGTISLLDCVSLLTQKYVSDFNLQLHLVQGHISPPEFCAQMNTPASNILAAFGRTSNDVAGHGIPVFSLSGDAIDQDTRYEGLVTPRSALNALLPSYEDPMLSLSLGVVQQG